MHVPPPPLFDAYVALGSNLGDRFGFLQYALDALGAVAGLTLGAASPVYESPAHTRTPDEVQPPYLNAVVRLRSALSPEELLMACLVIEAAAGRRRTRRWAPRTLDLDLLLYGTWTRATPGLTLPHPRLGDRRFVLQPLADLAPNLIVPAPYDSTVADLLARCPDPGRPHRTPLLLTTGARTTSGTAVHREPDEAPAGS